MAFFESNRNRPFYLSTPASGEPERVERKTRRVLRGKDEERGAGQTQRAYSRVKSHHCVTVGWSMREPAGTHFGVSAPRALVAVAVCSSDKMVTISSQDLLTRMIYIPYITLYFRLLISNR